MRQLGPYLTAAIALVTSQDALAQCSPQKTFSFDGNGASFGRSIALDGDDLVSGSPGVGAVWFHKYVANQWLPSAAPSYRSTATGYGTSVALSGVLAAIGVPYLDDTAGSAAGAVELWSYADGAWKMMTLIRSPSPSADANFGFAVDVEGDKLIVGEPGFDGRRGRAFIYTVDPQGLVTLDKTLSPTASITSGSEYGYAVAISGPNAVVGAPFADQSGFTDNGAAVFFRYDPSQSNWLQKNKMTFPDFNSHVGAAVAASGVRAVIGVPYLTSPGPSGRGGRAWITQWNGTNYSIIEQYNYLVGGYRFGASVAIDGPRAVIGAPTFDHVLSPGTADNGGFQLVIKNGNDFVPSGFAFTEPTELLGSAVAVSGPRVVIGAPGDDEGGAEQGALFTFEAAATAFHVDVTSVDTSIENAIFGAPDLLVVGSLCADEPTRLAVKNAPPLTEGWIIAGFSQVNQPLLGGLLGPNLTIIYPIITGPAGGYFLEFPWGQLQPSFSIFTQVFLLDASTPQGFSASRTLQLSTPY